MSAFGDISGLERLAIWDGVLARAVEGGRCSFAIVELDPGAVVREHSHEHEQLGMVITGSVRFHVRDETCELGPGGTWRIEPHAPHEVHAGRDGAVVLDVFAPARDDWASLERREPTAPRWPE